MNGAGGAASEATRTGRRNGLRWIAAGVVIACTTLLFPWLMPDPAQSRAAMIAAACLALWLTEAAPLYVTTLLLWAAVAALMGPLDRDAYALPSVLGWAAQPVMALFLGGLALSAAGARHGIDTCVAGWMVRLSRGSRALLLATVMAGTAALSMWMSNIAAAAMMIATLRPLFAQAENERRFRAALLLGVAFAADFGGMGTPIGTGPNLIAIGEVAPMYRITFLHWMLFAVPLTALMLALTFALLAVMFGVRGRMEVGGFPRVPLGRRGIAVVGLFVVTVIAWLSEPWHGVSAAVVALLSAAALFGSGLLDGGDLGRLDWSTLLLVAGGLTLGELLETSGLTAAVAQSVAWRSMPETLLLLSFLLACAMLSAVASNTAAAVILIPIGLRMMPEPSFAVLVALAASMGVPFVISTPPNSMAYGQGGLRTRDLVVPGVILMLAGCVLLALTGPTVLRWLGVP